jgi:hypothetical protein
MVIIQQLIYRLLIKFSSSFAVFELEDDSCITVYYFNDYCLVETEKGKLTKVTNREFNKLYKVTNIIYP